MGLRIQLLGKPRIIGEDGAERVVRGHQSWAVLARVLLSERAVGRRELAAELFPDAADPLGALRWCLAALRRAMGPDVLQGDPIAASLPADAEVDIRELARGVADGEQAGDLLEGVDPRAGAAFETWLLIERERTASLVDERIRQDTMLAISSGEFARAIRIAETGVRRRPFDEGAHILLTKSLVMDGRPEAALRHVEATEQAFLAELGEKPSPALRSAARPTIASAPLGVSPRGVVSSLIDSGVAALGAGAVEAGLDCLRRAASDAEAVGDDYLQAKALVELGAALVHAVRGYDDEGALHLRQAIAFARRAGAQDIAAKGLRELGYVESLAGRRPAAARILEEALEISGGDADGLAGIHGTMAYNLVDWGRIDEGLAHHETSLEHARAAGNRRREIWTLGLGGWGQLAAGRPEIACEWLTACIALCDDVRWLAFRPWPEAVLAAARLRLQEDPVMLRDGLAETFALSCQLGDPCWEAVAGRSIALTFAATDEYDEAMQWLIKSRALCTRSSDHYAALLVEILANQVEVSFKAGRPEQADAIAREYLSAAARTHADAHLARAVALIGNGRGMVPGRA